MATKYNNSMYTINLPEIIVEDEYSDDAIKEYIEYSEFEKQEICNYQDPEELRIKELIKNEQFY